ncbi:MAG: hypothetical protein WA188_18535 [Terriglobales bacterium]
MDLPPAELKKGILSAGTPEWYADALIDHQRFYGEGKASLVTDDCRTAHSTQADQV